MGTGLKRRLNCLQKCSPYHFIDMIQHSFLVHLAHKIKYLGTGSLKDVGFGNGQYYALNIPLRSGLNGLNFLKIFKNVVNNVLSCYSPDSIVMQCGVDGLFGDPLDGKWNLDIESFGEAVGFVLRYNIPTLLFGGGGYNQAMAARCWTYCTAVALEIEEIIPMDIPEHILLTEYGPDFRIFAEKGNQQDENDVGKYSDTLMNDALKLITKLYIETKENS